MRPSMMEYAKRVAVRRVVYIVIAAIIALASQFMGEARAQNRNYGDCTNYTVSSAWCQARNEAAQVVQQWIDNNRAAYSNNGLVACPIEFEDYGEGLGKYNGWFRQGGRGCDNRVIQFSRMFDQPVNCPAGTAWDEATNTCKSECPTGGWADPLNPGQCLSREICEAKNSEAKWGLATPRQGKSLQWCNGGCQMGFQAGASGAGVGSDILWTGKVYFDGNPCKGTSATGGPPNPPPSTPEHEGQKADDPNKCEGIGTLTMCKMPDGRFCHEASTGRMNCWKPHETGTKTDQDVVQKKEPGHQPRPDTITLPNGDTATKTSQTNVTEKTVGGQTSNTSVTNYQTTSGANAGESNQGQPNPNAPGGGSGSGNEGEGDEDGNSSTGGSDCAAPPQSKGDGLLAMIARQAWETRCQFDKMSDKMRESADALSSDNDAGEPSSDDNGWAGGEEDGEGDGPELDSGGLGFGAACPAPPAVSIGDTLFQWPDGFCELIAGVRWMLIAFAYIWGIRIVVGRD